MQIIKIILIFGIALRLLYASFFGFESYTHDSNEHIDYIKYVSKNLSLPKVDQGLEFPQQPLYYIVTGTAYHFLIPFFNEKQVLNILVWFSTLSSIGTLIFAYFLSKKICNSWWAQSFMTGFIAFTPAFVYQAGMISNDPFLTFLSASAIFFLICFIKNEDKKDIVLAILLGVLAILTKISGIIVISLIFLTLYFKNFSKISKKTSLTSAFAVLLIGALCFSMAIWRSYLPQKNIFFIVNSGSYDGQKINPSKPLYFLSFNAYELAKEGQSYIWGNKTITQSLPTYLYGTSIFGEYSYQNITKLQPAMKYLMQFIFAIGLIFPAGIILNLFFLKKWNEADYVFFLAAIFNLFLLVLFLFKFPSICNSDFRYFSPVFLPIAGFSAIGLLRLHQKIKFKALIPCLAFILISSEFVWIALRIAVKITYKA